MKCPKCGYISFDFNQVCPKCNKDISSEQEKLNLQSFRPDPPSLLAALAGDVSESSVGMGVNASSGFEAIDTEEEIGLDDSQDMEINLDDSQDMEISLDEAEDAGVEEEASELEIATEDSDLDMDMEETGVEEIAFESGEINLDDIDSSPSDLAEEEAPDELSIEFGEESETGVDTEPAQDELEDLTLELGEISIGEPEAEEIKESAGESDDELSIDLGDLPDKEPGTEAEPTQEAMEDLTLDLGDISVEEPRLGESVMEEAPDVDSSALEIEEPGAEGEKDEIELNLDDLKINDTGELEIGESIESVGELNGESADEIDQSLGMDEFSLDDIPSEEDEAKVSIESPEDMTLDLEETPMDESEIEGLGEPDAGSGTLKLENLDLDLDIDIDTEETEKNGS